MAEQDPPLASMLTELIRTLPPATVALTAYEAVHSSADKAAAAARAAHQQIQEAQVTVAC